jgi:hypothetical protein
MILKLLRRSEESQLLLYFSGFLLISGFDLLFPSTKFSSDYDIINAVLKHFNYLEAT